MQIYYINHLSERIVLTDGPFHVTEVNGVSLYTYIKSKENAFKHGADYISEHINRRKISIMIFPEGDYHDARETLSRIFRTGGEGRLYFDCGGVLRSIRCRTEKIGADLKARPDEIQISLTALAPFFESEFKAVVLRGVIGFLEFDDTWEMHETDNVLSEYGINTAVRSGGTNGSGCIVKSMVSTPCSRFTVLNTTTGERFTLKGNYMSGDEIQINSERKSVVLVRNGKNYDIMSQIEWGSVFPQIMPPEVRFTIETDDAYPEVSVIFKERFESV